MTLDCLHPPRRLLLFFWAAFQEATARSNDPQQVQRYNQKSIHMNCQDHLLALIISGAGTGIVD